ncbi:MAG: hypothetical protein RML72_07380 [Bacteroidia bacterium]|nr:hypothetical protein [Bacteroidia bacterium]MDW8158682.1 hypothetical protein [Bacteroidia bacterium]
MKLVLFKYSSVCVRLLLCFLLPLLEKSYYLAQAQTVVASLHLSRKEPKPLWFEYVRADDGLVTLSYMKRNSSRQIGIFKYNENFKRSWEKLVFEQNGRQNIEFLAVLGEKIYVFVSELAQKEHYKELYYYTYSLEGKVLASKVTLKKIPLLNGEEKAPIFFTYSLNKKLLLCHYRPPSEKRANSLEYFIFSADTPTIKSGKIPFRFKDDEATIKSIKLGNKGNIFLLFKRKDKGKPENEFRYYVSRFYTSSDSLIDIPLQTEDKYITDISFKPDKEENLYVCGFYSHKSTTQVIGVFYNKITLDSIVKFNFQRLDEKFLEKYLTPRQIQKGKELSDFYLDDIILRSDGGVLLLGEQYYITPITYQRTLQGVWYTRDLHHYDDIMIISLSPNGEIEWSNIITKSQSSEYHTELSYLCVVGGENINIFYKTRLKGTGTNVYYHQIDYSGNISPPKMLFENFSNNDIFYRDFSEQISNNEAIIAYYQSKGKIFSLLKIEF